MEAQFDAMEARLEEMQEAAAQPEIIADVPRWQRILQEIKRLTPAVTAYREYKALLSQLAQAREMLSDADFAAVAQEELNALAPQAEAARLALRRFLLPHDPNDERSVVMEVRPGAGGDEAALFAALLVRMYQRYAERRAPRRESEQREQPREEFIRPPRRQEKKAVRPRVRERQRVSGVLVLGFAALAAMVVVVLMSYAQLTSISADVVSMQKELKTLDAEHVALLTQYERTFDLETVKAAAAAAGMNKPSSSQINYIDLSAPDSVELCEAQNVSVLSRVFTSLGQGVFSVVEYFS